MKKRLIFAVLMMSLMLTGCRSSGTASADMYINESNPTPKIVKLSDVDPGDRDKYFYIVDKNTGVVYLAYDGYRQFGLTAMINVDGSAVTAEQLDLEY